MKTKNIFCANEQEVTEHVVTIDNNGEFVFTCDCGRFIKLPGDIKKDELKEALEAHKASNEGQLTVEEVEKANLEKLKLIDEA